MRTLLGATFAEPDYDDHLRRFAGLHACRVFSSSDAPPGWGDTRVRKLVAAGVVPFKSAKGYNPKALTKDLDSMPDDVPLAYYAHHHEPEGDGVPARTWAARQHTLYDLVRNHPNRPRVRFVTIQAKQWAENGREPYAAWWCGASDAFAVDAYVNSWGDPARYPDPAPWVAQMASFAKQVGKPLWLPELGAVSRPGDTEDKGRAVWIAGVLNALLASGVCELALWWCAMGTAGSPVKGLGINRNFHLDQRGTESGDTRLTIAPSEVMWKHFMSRGSTQ